MAPNKFIGLLSGPEQFHWTKNVTNLGPEGHESSNQGGYAQICNTIQNVLDLEYKSSVSAGKVC